jgi:DNA-binding response OmpR family regulator
MRILVIEDEVGLADALVHILNQNKYQADACYDGISGLDNALSNIYDLIILDVMLPKMNGFEILKNIRFNKLNVPVILLTAKDEVSYKITGLDIGADDYLTKPFNTDELLARIRSIFRRNSNINFENTISYNDVSLNLMNYELSSNNKSLKLGLKEFCIMEMLIKNSNIIISKEKLIEKVWGYESNAEYNNVEVYISFLRKKLSHIDSKVIIKTIRGVGYSLEVGENVKTSEI